MAKTLIGSKIRAYSIVILCVILALILVKIPGEEEDNMNVMVGKIVKQVYKDEDGWNVVIIMEDGSEYYFSGRKGTPRFHEGKP